MTKKLLMALILASAVLAAGPGRAAINYYFNMDGLPSDGSQAIGHPNDIEVSSFSWGVTTNAAGPPTFSFTLQKLVSPTSPMLAANCANGVASPTATLSCYKSAGGGSASTTAFYSVTLTNVVVSSVNVQSDPTGEFLNEVITLQFDSVQWSYSPQKPDGSLGTPIVTSYIAP